LIVKKVEPLDTVDQAYGRLGKGRNTDDIMQELRGTR
jgi:hypothetical protein